MFRVEVEHKYKWILIDGEFETAEAARKWADWNYMGRGGFRIVEIIENYNKKIVS